MKYVLVDSGDNIVNTIELGSNIGVSGARTYFLGVKRIDKKEFNKLWRVMTEESYTWLKKHTRKLSSERTDYPSYIRWWEEDKKITDEELE
tara:strand:- start:279 stop:551 length:273 start_codon:yes stop_codon:yes gene_type:complete